MPESAFIPASSLRSPPSYLRDPSAKCPLRQIFVSCARGEPPRSTLPSNVETSANSSLLEHGLVLSSSSWKPPRLTVYIDRTNGDGASSDDCATASNVLSEVLDAHEFGAGAYTLEVSTPGAADVLQHDYEFAAFKGFPIRVTATEVFKKKTVFEGRLAGRSESAVRVNLNGRIVDIPREIVAEVRLSEGKEE